MNRSLTHRTARKIHNNYRLRKEVFYIPHKYNKDKALFACPLVGCNKVFTRKLRLNNHMKEHYFGVRSHKCTFPGCSKSFNEKSNLKIHMRVHTNERPFMCSLDGCDKTFRTKANCKDHERRHLADK